VCIRHFKLNSTLTVLILQTFPSILDVGHPFLAYIRTGYIASLPQSTVMAKASAAKSKQIVKAKSASTTSDQKMKKNLVGKPSARS
jgi:hypothetical protein